MASDVKKQIALQYLNDLGDPGRIISQLFQDNPPDQADILDELADHYLILTADVLKKVDIPWMPDFAEGLIEQGLRGLAEYTGSEEKPVLETEFATVTRKP